MGLGRLAGIEGVRWLRQNDGGYAYEQVTNGKTYCGRKNARASAIVSCSDALDVTYAQGAQVNEYTALYDSFRRRTAHGQAVVDGRVLVYPFGNFESSVSIPPMLLNSMRQAVLHDVLRTAGAPFPLVCGAPYLEPYCFVQDGGLDVYLVNGSTDDADAVELAFSAGTAPESAEVWRSYVEQAAPQAAVCEAVGTGVRVPVDVPSMEAVLLRMPAPGAEGETPA